MKLKIIVALFLFPIFLSAQHFDSGLTLGASNYLGDLAPSQLWTSIGETKLGVGAFARYNINDWMGVRLDLTYATIGATDESSLEQDFRKNRNLSFRSDIYEMALLTEFNILGYHPEGLDKYFSPYIFAGIAVFKFNPQAEYQGEWHDLQPLGTEGQGLPGFPTKYSRTQISIPMGLGLKIALSEKINLAFESGLRKTHTDYLDDVSNSYPDLATLADINGELSAQLSWRYDEIDADATPPLAGSGRGDPGDKDWYILSRVTFSFNFFKGGAGGKFDNKRSKKNTLGCPSF